MGSGTGIGAYDTDALVKMAAGLLEMTVGCSSVSSINAISMEIKTILCSFYISFGGISVAAQSMSMMRGTGMKTLEYLRLKVFQGITSAAVTMGFIYFMW